MRTFRVGTPMHLHSAQFGQLEFGASDLLLFPEGLNGATHLHNWLLLEEQPLMWLQSVEDSEIALPLVSPFLFVPVFRLSLPTSHYRVTRTENAAVFVSLSRFEDQWAIELGAPLLIWPALRLGQQVLSATEQPLQLIGPRYEGILRKSA